MNKELFKEFEDILSKIEQENIDSGLNDAWNRYKDCELWIKLTPREQLESKRAFYCAWYEHEKFIGNYIYIKAYNDKEKSKNSLKDALRESKELFENI